MRRSREARKLPQYSWARRTNGQLQGFVPSGDLFELRGSLIDAISCHVYKDDFFPMAAIASEMRRRQLERKGAGG